MRPGSVVPGLAVNKMSAFEKLKAMTAQAKS